MGYITINITFGRNAEELFKPKHNELVRSILNVLNPKWKEEFHELPATTNPLANAKDVGFLYEFLDKVPGLVNLAGVNSSSKLVLGVMLRDGDEEEFNSDQLTGLTKKGQEKYNKVLQPLTATPALSSVIESLLPAPQIHFIVGW